MTNTATLIRAGWLSVALLPIVLLSACGGTGRQNPGENQGAPPPLVAGLNGTVNNQAGAPVPGVSIQVLMPTAGAAVAETAATATTDATGSYRIAGIAPGTYNLIAAKDDLGAFKEGVVVTSEGGGPGRVEANLTVRAFGTLQGKVSLEGSTDPTGVIVLLPGTTYVAAIDATGRFSMNRVPEGTYSLTASAAGYARQVLSGVQVTAGGTTVLNQTVTLSRLTVVVASVDKAFAAVGEEVTITGTSFGTARGTSAVTFGNKETGNADYLSWSDTRIVVRVPAGAGSSRLAVRTPLGEAEASKPLQILGQLVKVSGDNQQADPKATLPEPLVMRVVDTDGRPVAGVTVRFTASRGTLSAGATVTGQDGRAAVTFTLPDSWDQQDVTATVDKLAPVKFLSNPQGQLRVRNIYDYIGDRAGTPWELFELNGEYNYPEPIVGGWPIAITRLDGTGGPGASVETTTLVELTPEDGRVLSLPVGRYRVEQRLPTATQGGGAWSMTGASWSQGSITTPTGAVNLQIVTIGAGEMTVARFLNVCRVEGQVQVLPREAVTDIQAFAWACKPIFDGPPPPRPVGARSEHDRLSNATV